MESVGGVCNDDYARLFIVCIGDNPCSGKSTNELK